MSSSGAPSPLGQKGIKRMLSIFGVLAVLGVLTLLASVPIGLLVLVVAEAFFVIAYRRFSRLQNPSK